MTLIKVIGLFGLIAVLFALGHGNAHPASPEAASPIASHGPIAIGAAALAAMAAYNGWANVAMIGGEVQRPERNVPWALVVGIPVVVGLYVGANLAFLHVLPMADIMNANSSAHPEATSVASRAAAVVLGAHAGAFLSVLFMISAVGTLHCNMLSVPRVFFAMARDGLLPQALGGVSGRAGTPYLAIIAFASIAALFALAGGYDRLADMATFGFVLFFWFNAVGFLWWRLRNRPGSQNVGQRYVWVATLFLLGTSWLLVALMERGSMEIRAALAILAAGVPVYAWMRFRSGTTNDPANV